MSSEELHCVFCGKPVHFYSVKSSNEGGWCHIFECPKGCNVILRFRGVRSMKDALALYRRAAVPDDKQYCSCFTRPQDQPWWVPYANYCLECGGRISPLPTERKEDE